ncbi:MAG TPA: LytTR family DNA-binding domain-containing protein [Gammaproteobacteria bacterium]
MNQTQELMPATARKIAIWQMVFFAGLLLAVALSNIFSTLTDSARMGGHIAWWNPTTWEFSSVIVVWCLVFPVAWWLQRFPLDRASWWRSLPAHILFTFPYSLVHVGAMVGLRKLVYVTMGESYDFGAWWPNWFYEYRKDLVGYLIIVTGLMAFRIYGLWLDSHDRSAGSAPGEAQTSKQTLERLVVRKLNREFILSIGDIDRIEADGNYVTVYVKGDSYPLRESLVTLEKRLDQKHFARVHRGHIVNIDRIREIQPWDHGDYRIVLKDGSFVNFSRRYRSRLNHLFG